MLLAVAGATILSALAACHRRAGGPPSPDATLAWEETLLAPLVSQADIETRPAGEGGGEFRIGVVTPSPRGDPAGAPRMTLLAPLESNMTFRWTPGGPSRLVFAAGVEGRENPAGAPSRSRVLAPTARFSVSIDGEEVWSRTVAPAVEGDAGRWHEGEVDLAPFAGRERRFEFRTAAAAPASPGDGSPGARGPWVGGWSRVRIVRRHEVPRRPVDRRHPRVVCVLVDTLRADALGVLGASRPSTPHVDAWAGQGLVFECAITPSSWTLPSVATLFTGLLPAAHGVVGPRRSLLVEDLHTLAERFEAVGVTTGAFVASPVVSNRRNFGQGFETFWQRPGAGADAVQEELLAWLERHRNVQTFSYVHVMEPHDPYQPPGPWRERFRDGYEGPVNGSRPVLEAVRAVLRRRAHPDDPAGVRLAPHVARLRSLYDGEVAAWDASFGKLLEELRARDLRKDTVVVLTGDHGEEFAEHGNLTHGHALWEELLRVPLILTGPGILPAGRVTRPVPWASLALTLAEILDVPDTDGLAGPSLLSIAREESRPPAVISSVEGGVLGHSSERHTIHAIRTERWKLTWWPEEDRVQLFDLAVDPGERHDLLVAPPAGNESVTSVARSLLETLRARIETDSRNRPANVAPIDDAMRNALGALGYLR